MSDRPDDLLSGLDGPRQLRPALRSQLEARLRAGGSNPLTKSELVEEARPVRPGAREALTEAMTDDGIPLMAGLDASRPLRSDFRSTLESQLLAPSTSALARRSARLWWLSGAAAACLLAAVTGAVTLGSARHPAPTATAGVSFPTSLNRSSAPTKTGGPSTANGDTAEGGLPADPVANPASRWPTNAASPSGAAAGTTGLSAAIIRVAPDSGPVAGGTAVVITGTDLRGVTAVRFGAVPAQTFSVVSPTEIHVTSPAQSAGTVDVFVLVGPHTSPPGPSDRFTYAG